MIWDFILHQIPWWVYAGLAALIALLVLRTFGVKWGAVAAIVLGALVVLDRARQAGYNAREARGKKETEIAIKQANEARVRANKWNADPKRLRDDDGFRRD